MNLLLQMRTFNVTEDILVFGSIILGFSLFY